MVKDLLMVALCSLMCMMERTKVIRISKAYRRQTITRVRANNVLSH
jgi:hypothetical protein